MKLVIVSLCAILLLSSTEAQVLEGETLKEMKTEVMKYAKECFRQTNSTERDLMALYNLDKNTDDVKNNTKCFISCMLQKIRMMDENGELKVNFMKHMVQFIPNVAAKTLVTENIDFVAKQSSAGDNNCEKAYLFIVTVYKKLMENPEVQSLLTAAKTIAGELLYNFHQPSAK